MFFVQLNGTNLAVVDVPGTGGWYNWQNVVIPDVEVSSGEQFFKIQIVQAGFNITRIKFESLVSVEDEPIIVKSFQLGNAYPNLFNPNVRLSLNVSKKGEHIGAIHSLDGKIVKEFNYGVLESGDHVVKWDGLDNYRVHVHSGVYFFKLTD